MLSSLQRVVWKQNIQLWATGESQDQREVCFRDHRGLFHMRKNFQVDSDRKCSITANEEASHQPGMWSGRIHARSEVWGEVSS